MTAPNILWICTDQQRWDTLGVYGNSWVNTPNIDRLAESGLVFDYCYSQSTVCTPSRASFLTGRYPRTCRGRQNGADIPPEEILITKAMADVGYNCGLAGKLHISASNPSVAPIMEPRINDGYSVFNWSHDRSDAWPTNEYHNWLAEKGVEYSSQAHPECNHIRLGPNAEHHQTTWCVEKAINFIRNNAKFDQPWLHSVNIYDPHHSFETPADYLQRYLDRIDDIPLPNYIEGELNNKPVFQQFDHLGAYNSSKDGTTEGAHHYPTMTERDHRMITASYWAMCDLVDSQVGRLLDALESSGEAENTLVIFMSDHGEMLGDHGLYWKGPFFYEPAVRVPLIVAWKGQIEAGRRSQALVELSDIAPTILDAAGVEHPAGMQAKSLWPLINGSTAIDHHREDVYSEYYNAMPWHSDPTAQTTMVRTKTHKIVAAHGTGSGELYDLNKDPKETQNLWSDPESSDLKLEMYERLADRMAWTVDPLPLRKSEW